LYQRVSADKVHNMYEIDIVNGYPRITGTGIFNTRILTGQVHVSCIIVSVPVDTRTRYTLI